MRTITAPRSTPIRRSFPHEIEASGRSGVVLVRRRDGRGAPRTAGASRGSCRPRLRAGRRSCLSRRCSSFLCVVYVAPFLGVAAWSVTLPTVGLGQYERLVERLAGPLRVPAHVSGLRDRHRALGRRGLCDCLRMGARVTLAAAADRALHPHPLLDFGPDARLRLAGAACPIGDFSTPGFRPRA